MAKPPLAASHRSNSDFLVLCRFSDQSRRNLARSNALGGLLAIIHFYSHGR